MHGLGPDVVRRAIQRVQAAGDRFDPQAQEDEDLAAACQGFCGRVRQAVEPLFSAIRNQLWQQEHNGPLQQQRALWNVLQQRDAEQGQPWLDLRQRCRAVQRQCPQPQPLF